MMYLKIDDTSSKSTEKQMMQQKILQILCEFWGLQAILRISVVPVLHLVLKISSFGTKFVNSIYLSYNLYLCFRCWSYEETRHQHWNRRIRLVVKSMWTSQSLQPSEVCLSMLFPCLSQMNLLPSFFKCLSLVRLFDGLRWLYRYPNFMTLGQQTNHFVAFFGCTKDVRCFNDQQFPFLCLALHCLPTTWIPMISS